MPYKTTRIIIEGTIKGNIWTPYEECTKDFRVQFTVTDESFSHPWVSLRDALLHITNDGDFRDCGIEQAWLTVERSNGQGTRRTRTVTLDYGSVTQNQDCFVEF